MFSAIGRWANRFVTTIVIVLLVALLGASVALNLGEDLLVGSTTPGPPLEAALGAELPGAVPAPGSRTATGEPPRVALTFDDGPDRVQTPRILDILAEHNVKATFFLLGEQIGANRDLVERIVDEGHEIGLHSYNHPRLGDLPHDDVIRQFRLNQMAVVGAVGVKPVIARPPYSFSATQLSPAEYDSALAAQQAGFVMVFSELAPPDYRDAPPEVLAAAGLPAAGESAIITLHDRAGPRAESTAEALQILIPELDDRGYEFVTASEYGGVGASPTPSRSERLISASVLATAALYTTLATYVQPLVYAIAPILILRFFAILGLAWNQNRRHRRRMADDKAMGGPLPSVSLIVPAYNEEVGIVDALVSFKRLDYDGDLEILVVDDGSTDRTAELAAGVNGVRVLSKPNGGKASALNAGIRAASNDICVLVDGDTVFESDTVATIVRPFSDPSVGAVSGYPRVGNRNNLLARMQNVEYIMGCSLIRRAQERLAMISCLPGAIGAFRRSALLDVGGVPEYTLAEDTDLTMALGSHGWRLAYVPESTAWTEVPVDLKTLWKQRIRWSYGVFQVLWRHRHGPDNEPSRRYRWSVMAYTLFDYLLAVLTPIVDLLALVSVLGGGAGNIVWLVAGTFLAQIVTVAYAIHLDRDSYRSLLDVPAQVLFFRYFNLFVVFTATWSAITGRREKWNKPKRIGLGAKPGPAADMTVSTRVAEPV